MPDRGSASDLDDFTHSSFILLFTLGTGVNPPPFL